MTRSTILKMLIQVLLLPSTVAFGQIQMHGQGTSSWTFGVGDNTPNCTVAGVSCLYNHSGGSFVRVIPTGGKVVGIDSSGCGYLYSDPMNGGNNTWTKQTAWGCGLVKVWYASDGNIYALTSAKCDSTNHKLQEWTSGAWADTIACGPDFSFGPQGTSVSVGIGTDSKIDISTNYFHLGGTYEVNGCDTQGGANSVAMLGGSIFAVACKDQSVWFGAWGNGTSTVSYVQLSPGGGVQVAGAGPTVWIIGGDGAAYRWRLDQDTSWQKFTGPGSALTYIGYGDIYNLWAVAGGTYRLTEYGLAASNTWNTSTVCTLNGQRTTCPSHSSQPPVQHTTTQIWHWQLNGVHKQGGSASVGPYDPSISQLVNTTGVLDDPVGCSLDFVACVIGEDSGELDCSQDGELAAVPPVTIPIPHFKPALTHSRRASGPPAVFGHLGWLSYGVGAECSNGTPVWNPIEIVADSDNPNAFDSSALCISWGSGPYVCYELAPYPPGWGVAIAEYGGTSKQGQPNMPDPGPQECTQ